jgi:hypothetical protein
MHERKIDPYWHCDHCGYEFKTEEGYYGHPKYCPDCRHSKDWQSGRTANCKLCDNQSICHEPYKSTCPEYHKTCLYFKLIGDN